MSSTASGNPRRQFLVGGCAALVALSTAYGVSGAASAIRHHDAGPRSDPPVGSEAAPFVLRSYPALPPDAPVTNPERGFFKRRELHLFPGADYQPLDRSELESWRADLGYTIVHRTWCLERYAPDGLLEDPTDEELKRYDLTEGDEGDLGKIRDDFQTAWDAGVKLLVRFAYSNTSGHDAQWQVAERHIKQLAPVLNEFAAVIFAVEAGFIGQYGEWASSERYGADDWTTRGRVLNTLLDNTSVTIPVLVRTPAIKLNIVTPATGPRARRVGVHNDCFLAGRNDAGTFPEDDPATGHDESNRTWLARQTRSVLMAGETCMPGPRSPWDNAKLELAKYHWDALYRDYNKEEVLDQWEKVGGLAEATAKLGYRLRLVSATLPTKATAGQPMDLTLTFANNGYSNLKLAHPAFLVLQGAPGTKPVKVKLPIDLTRVAPETAPGVPSPRTFSVSVTAPSTTGTYTMYLAVQDSSSALAGNPKYNIAMANEGMWTGDDEDDSTDPAGWNRLGATLTIAN